MRGSKKIRYNIRGGYLMTSKRFILVRLREKNTELYIILNRFAEMRPSSVIYLFVENLQQHRRFGSDTKNISIQTTSVR